MMRGSTLLLHP